MSHVSMQEEFENVGAAFVGRDGVPFDAVTNFKPGWEDKYFSEGFHKVDPVIEKVVGLGNRSGASLLRVDDMSSPLFEEAKLYDAASNFVAVSTFGGSKYVVGAVVADADDREVSRLKQVCDRHHLGLLMARIDRLRIAQIELLELSEEGLQDKEMAFELDVSISAIAQRKKGVCKDVGVETFKSALSLYSMRKWSGIVPM